MNTQGQHLLLDIWLKVVDVEYVADGFCEYIENHFTVVNSVQHEFTQQGRTIVLVLSESHFTIHTYPENNFISLDLYICNMETDLEKVTNDLLNMTSVEHVEGNIRKRGFRK